MSRLYATDNYQNPDWPDVGGVHDWRNYINDNLRGIWHTFTSIQQLVIAENAQDQADNEEWD